MNKQSMKKDKKADWKNKKNMACNGSGIYGLGFIGAAIYYLSHATTFWDGAFGIIKALLWPAFLAYKLFGFLGM